MSGNETSSGLLVQLKNLNTKYRNVKGNLRNRLACQVDAKYLTIIDSILSDDEQLIQSITNKKYETVQDIIKDINDQLGTYDNWVKFQDDIKNKYLHVEKPE